MNKTDDVQMTSKYSKYISNPGILIIFWFSQDFDLRTLFRPRLS